jgi:trigger factor
VKVSTEPLPPAQVVLQLEVEDERLERAIESTYRRLAKRVKVPGFRPGKVPRAVLERHLGGDAVRLEAIDELMPQLYREAIEQEQIDPIDRAQYELVTEHPLVAKFTVPLKPSVDLGDYHALNVEREPVTVEPERVQEALESLRRRYATLEPVERPVQWGDIVRADIKTSVEGEAQGKDEDAEFQLVEGRVISLPGFAEALIGREKGAEFEFDVPVPDEVTDERLRGKQAHYRVALKEVKQEVLPELDDEFARQAGEGFPSLEALRERVEADLRDALEEQARHRYEDEVLDALADRAQLEYPPVLIERETERFIREQSGLGPADGRRAPKGGPSEREQLERYLRQAGKSEQELREEVRPLAEARIRRSLVLSELAEAEHIEVNEPEVEAEIERLASGVSQADELRRLFSSDNAKESLRRSLLTRKTLDRLVEIASGEAAPQESEPEETSEG